MTFGSNEEQTIAAINVTPLVDITLVLLIVLMVTSKVVASLAVPVDLPAAASAEQVQLVFSVLIAADGSLLVDGERLSNDDAMVQRARAKLKQSPELRAVINADGGVEHRRVMQVVDRLRGVGLSKLAFGASPLEAGGGS